MEIAERNRIRPDAGRFVDRINGLRIFLFFGGVPGGGEGGVHPLLEVVFPANQGRVLGGTIARNRPQKVPGLAIVFLSDRRCDQLIDSGSESFGEFVELRIAAVQFLQTSQRKLGLFGGE